MNKYLLIVAAFFLILGFQNCSNTASFDAAGALVAKSDGSIEDDGLNTHDGVIDDVADDMPGSAPSRSPVPNYVGHRDEDDEADSDNHDDTQADLTSKASYVCVLESSSEGKNVRLGYSASGLSNDQSAVNDVCMSEKACLETVSKAFPVKGAEKRGYCSDLNTSENFVRMSDKEIEDAITKEMLKRMMSSK